jgi:hypothetical protein
MKQLTDLLDILADPELFFALLKIKDKSGRLINLSLNGEQRQLLKAYYGTKNNILCIKPRQIGSSTFWTAMLFYEWYTSATPRTFFSMSHTQDSSDNFMNMWLTYYEGLPAPLKRPLATQNSTTLELADTGAKLVVKTAGGKGGVRSFSCNILHMSEFAFYDDAEETMATAIPALNGGRLVIESTPNYYGDGLHQRALQALDGVPWEFIFFPWYQHEEYQLDAPEGFQRSVDEQELAERCGLTDNQLCWRRKQIHDMGLQKFQRDYPVTLDEAYSQGATSYLSYELEGIKEISIVGKTEYTWEQPTPGVKYAIGVDTSLGVKKDYSWIWVVNAHTRDVAYTWFSNVIKPTDLATKVAHVSATYNDALTLVESNNTGLGVLQELNRIGHKYLWQHDGKDWTTNSKTKPELMEVLRKQLQAKTCKQLDSYTLGQLRGLQVEKNRVVFPKHALGHADSVMALALAFRCVQDVILHRPEQSRQFALPKPKQTFQIK